MQTCDPSKARQWFKLREPVNWVVTIVAFVPVFFFLTHILDVWLAVAIAIAGAFCLFFFVLDSRAISIECPHCHGHIETNTAWICGNSEKQCRNDQVDDFPFIYKCQHCGFIPKAYQCHHCNELIFFTKDKQRAGYARCADKPVKSKSSGVEKDAHAKAIIKKHKEIQIKELAVQDAKLAVELKSLGQALETPKVKPLEDKFRGILKDEDDARRLKAAIDEEFKNDPVEREKRNRIVDDLMRDMLR
jgi:hypothetical protein